MQAITYSGKYKEIIGKNSLMFVPFSIKNQKYNTQMLGLQQKLRKGRVQPMQYLWHKKVMV